MFLAAMLALSMTLRLTLGPLADFEQVFEWLAQICKGVPAIVSVKVREWKAPTS